MHRRQDAQVVQPFDEEVEEVMPHGDEDFCQALIVLKTIMSFSEEEQCPQERGVSNRKDRMSTRKSVNISLTAAASDNDGGSADHQCQPVFTATE